MNSKPLGPQAALVIITLLIIAGGSYYFKKEVRRIKNPPQVADITIVTKLATTTIYATSTEQ